MKHEYFHCQYSLHTVGCRSTLQSPASVIYLTAEEEVFFFYVLAWFVLNIDSTLHKKHKNIVYGFICGLNSGSHCVH